MATYLTTTENYRMLASDSSILLSFILILRLFCHLRQEIDSLIT